MKTGLEPRQVSNWFTNVRKRIWQPIKKKNKNKGAKDLMLKVKLRLESNSNSRASSSENERSSGQLSKNKEADKIAPGTIKFEIPNAFKLLENSLA